jgi:hypothetical protein
MLQQLPPREPDQVFNYASNICHWTLQLMSMDDTIKEGDFSRLVINSKMNLPFFLSHSKLSKYFVENVNFILQAKHLLSPQMSLRVLEGAFVNVRGGAGNNVEADLCQEHSVRNRKDLVRALGANKTNAAIIRVTNASDTIVRISRQFDATLGIHPPSSTHTRQSTAVDEGKVLTAVIAIRPFHKTPGRVCVGFRTITASPWKKLDRTDMHEHLATTIDRLCRGLVVPVEEDERDIVEDEGLPDI